MSNQNGPDAVTSGIVTQVSATVSPSDSPTSLGFCHSCNKQTQINIEAYNCSECNGGFIEVFNLNASPSPIINTDEPRVPRPNLSNENEQSSSSESNTSSANPSFYLVNPGSQTERTEEFSPLTTPLFQLIRRLNNRRVRASNIVNSEFSNETSQNNETSVETDSDSNSASQENNSTQANPSAPGTSFNHFRYELSMLIFSQTSKMLTNFIS